MQSSRFIEHDGKQILLQDFSHVLEMESALAAVAEARRFVQELSAASGSKLELLILTDVEGSNFDSHVIDAIKELAVHHRPHARASAVIGLTPLKRVVLRLIVIFSQRKVAPFETREQALGWLVAQ